MRNQQHKLTLAVLILYLLIASTAAADEIDDAVIDIGGCSGVIIASDTELAYGVSAAHCVGSVDGTSQFTTRSGKAGGLRWKAVDNGRDLALFVVFAKDIDGFCQVITPIPEGGDWIGLGYPGKAHGAAARKTLAFNAQIDSIESTGGRRVTDRNVFRIPRGLFGGGDSGGGVFVASERHGVTGLVGVMSHTGDGDQTMYASTNRTLVAFLAEHDSIMSAQCRNGYCERWPTAPPPPPGPGTAPRLIPSLPGSLTQTGQHGLPEFMDSDRERGEIILKLITRLEALEAENQQLSTTLQQISERSPAASPAGPRGPAGQPGPAGVPGPAGTSPTVDMDKLIAEVIRRIPQTDPVDLDQLASEVKKRLPPIPASFQIRPRTKGK